MYWYGVHVVMAVRYKHGKQDVFPAWENIYLINAENSEEAAHKGEVTGKKNEGDASGSFYWDDQPAEWLYMGVRKVIQVSNACSPTNEVGDGAEITYQTLEFNTEKALKNYVNSKPTKLRVVE